MITIVNLVDEVLSEPENENVITSVKKKVNALMKDRTLFTV